MTSFETPRRNAFSEYIPQENEGQHNGNGNGNGHSKAFRLAPIVSPEEEARTEVLREIAPKIRRKIREDSRLSAGAKFFFYALFDDCFWHSVGGHGTGQIFADIRTLSDRYGHDEKSIVRWRYELSEAGWLWTNYEWPMTEWRLTPLLPAPVSSPQKKAIQMALGRATKPVGETPTSPHASRNSAKPSLTPDDSGQNDVSKTPNCPTPVGILPDARGHFGVDSVGETPTGVGRNAHGPPPKCPQASGVMPTGVRQDAHGQSEDCQTPNRKTTRPLARISVQEKSPGELEQGESSSKRSTRLNAQKVGRKASPENVFLLDVAAMMESWKRGSSNAELSGSGAWWRLAFRADRTLLRKILAETLMAMKERRIETTPGQYAADLWTRWGGNIPKP